MPSVAELSDPLANVMLSPAAMPGRICATCTTPIANAYTRCYACSQQPDHLAAVLPVAYSVGGEQYHLALRHYKDGRTPALRNRLTVQLAAVLWRFLLRHEAHLAEAAGVERFDRVITVPSHAPQRDEDRPGLRRLVGELCGPTRDRYERLLRATGSGTSQRRIERDRYAAVGRLGSDAIMLIDDTWTTGSRAQSAALALADAGAGAVALVVLGRHVNREFADNDRRLRTLPRPFEWDRCVLERI